MIFYVLKNKKFNMHLSSVLQMFSGVNLLKGNIT